MPFFTVYGRGANGKRSMLRGSVQAAVPIGVSRNGPKQVFFGCYGAQGLLDYDALMGLDWEWQAMDGAMTKAPLGKEKTGPNPTDRAKRGVKWSLLVEGHGIPIGLEVEGANYTDFKMLQATLQSIPIARPEPTEEQKQNLCLDKGYDYNEVRE